MLVAGGLQGENRRDDRGGGFGQRSLVSSFQVLSVAIASPPSGRPDISTPDVTCLVSTKDRADTRTVVVLALKAGRSIVDSYAVQGSLAASSIDLTVNVTS